MTHYSIDGDPARGIGYGLIFAVVCWLLIYGAWIGFSALVQWVAR